jgi:hypothetical protein
MRFPSLILTLALTFAIGLGLNHVHELAVEWHAPAFTGEEAAAMVGRRVRHTYWTDKFAVVKCPESGGRCVDVRAGDRGSIIGVNEISPNRYFLVVRWDKAGEGEPMLSGFGRMTRRVFLDVE